jgi:WD40 repeat protein
LAAGGEQGLVVVWNAGNAEKMYELRCESAVTAIAFSPDNQKLAIADSGKSVYIYGPPTPPQPGVELVLHQQLASAAPLTRLEFSVDSRTLFSSDVSGQILEWAYASPVALRQFNHGGPVFGVAISGDASTIVSCSADQTVRIWDAKTGGQRAQLNGHQGAVYGVTLSRDGALIVSSGADNTLRLWDVQGGRQLKQLASTGATMYSLAVHPNNTLIAAGGADRNVHFLDMLTGNLQRTLTGHQDFVHSVTFNAQGSRALSYGYAGTILVWNPADGQKVFESQVGRVGNTARYSPDGTRLLLATGDGMARIIELPAAAR